MIMSLNSYFNNYNANNEQKILEDLTIESIKMYGIDVTYIPRQRRNFDELYGEDTVSLYSTNYDFEVYIKSIDGFTGDGTFLSKFGLEIRDEITLSVAIKRFDEVVPSNMRTRPLEGDLIYFELGNRVFYIKYVNHRPIFYQLGKLYVYDLVCETWEYSSEEFDTGIPYLDNLETTRSRDTAITGNTIFDIPSDAHADNEIIQQEANVIIDFTEENPFGEF